MGTRNLTMVVLDGEIKISQYCQWDGYPTGQGITIAEFLQNTLNLPKFKKRVRELKELSDKEVGRRWEECGADSSGLVSFDIADKFKLRYPYLSRDCGAKILELIQDGIYKYEEWNSKAGNYVEHVISCVVDGIVKNIDFAADSLFCEYAYVIDLDNETVEVYNGFNDHFLDATERFAHLTEKSRGEYKPIKLSCIIPFNEFTVDNMQHLESYLANE